MSVLLIIVSLEFSKVTGAELALKKEFFFHAHTPVVKLFFICYTTWSILIFLLVIWKSVGLRQWVTQNSLHIRCYNNRKT